MEMMVWTEFVITQVDDKNGNLNISYEYGFFLSKLRSSIKTYPFMDVVEYFKSYPNFSYGYCRFNNQWIW